MSPTERWKNSETGEIYELEWPDMPPYVPEAPAAAHPAPVAALPPAEPSEADLGAHKRPGARLWAGIPPVPVNPSGEPRRARLLARIMRQILEVPDDAA